jgi:hypothetical protein
MEQTPANHERMHIANPYPKSVYIQSLAIFFGANYLFHQNVFRRSGSRPQFAAFMLVNVFTSLQIAEACNWGYARRTATIFDNTKEIEHRS